MRVGLLLTVVSAVFITTTAGCDDLSPAQSDGGTNAEIPIDPPSQDKEVLRGEIKELFGSKVTSWAILDANTKKLTALKWTLPLAAVDNVPRGLTSSVRYWLKVPPEVAKQTVFTGISLDFLPHGHPPSGVYNVPHWEFHLLAFSQEETVAIDCSDPTFPPDSILPKEPGGWFVLPPPENCSPGMGYHAVHPALPELNKEVFTRTFVPNYYRGKLSSFEIKANSTFLTKRESFTLKTPEVPLERDSLIPRNLVVTYDRPSDTYVFAMTDFVKAEVQK